MGKCAHIYNASNKALYSTIRQMYPIAEQTAVLGQKRARYSHYSNTACLSSNPSPSAQTLLLDLGGFGGLSKAI